MKKNILFNCIAVLASVAAALAVLLLVLFGKISVGLFGAYLFLGLSILAYASLLVMSVYCSTGKSLGLVYALREQRFCLTAAIPGTFLTSLFRAVFGGLSFQASMVLLFCNVAACALFIVTCTWLVFGVLKSFSNCHPAE